MSLPTSGELNISGLSAGFEKEVELVDRVLPTLVWVDTIV